MDLPQYLMELTIKYHTKYERADHAMGNSSTFMDKKTNNMKVIDFPDHIARRKTTKFPKTAGPQKKRLAETLKTFNAPISDLIRLLAKHHRSELLEAVEDTLGYSQTCKDEQWTKASDIANLSVNNRASLRKQGIKIPSEEQIKRQREVYNEEAPLQPKPTIRHETISKKGASQTCYCSAFELVQLLNNGILLRIKNGLLPVLPIYHIKFSGDGFRKWKRKGQVALSIQYLDMDKTQSQNAVEVVVLSTGSETESLLKVMFKRIIDDLKNIQGEDGIFRIKPPLNPRLKTKIRFEISRHKEKKFKEKIHEYNNIHSDNPRGKKITKSKSTDVTQQTSIYQIWRRHSPPIRNENIVYELLSDQEDLETIKVELKLTRWQFSVSCVEAFDQPNWIIDFSFSSDQKFSNLALNLTSPVATFWCSWCSAHKTVPTEGNEDRTMLGLILSGFEYENLFTQVPAKAKTDFTAEHQGVRGIPYFPFLSLKKWGPEFLHLLMRIVEAQALSTAKSILDNEGLPALKIFDEKIANLTGNSKDRFYHSPNEPLKRVRFSDDEPYTILAQLPNLQFINADKYQSNSSQMNLKFRTISTICLSLAFFTLRQGDMDQKFVVAESSSTRSLKELNFLEGALRKDVVEMAFVLYLFYALLGYGAGSITNSSHVAVCHLVRTYLPIIKNFIKNSNYGIEGIVLLPLDESQFY